MIRSQTSNNVAGYHSRYASALYMGGRGCPPRSGLVQRQYYVGQILDEGRFRVLRPERLCSITEFLSFQLVSRCWNELSQLERSLLLEVYRRKKLPLVSLSTETPLSTWNDAAACLSRAGYLRWTDEAQVVELTLVGEAEIEHQIFNLNAGDCILDEVGGIRITHHSPQTHEIDLGRMSTLFINVDGMRIRIVTLRDSGAVVRVDYDATRHDRMSCMDENRVFTQDSSDRAAALAQPELIQIGEKR